MQSAFIRLFLSGLTGLLVACDSPSQLPAAPVRADPGELRGTVVVGDAPVARARITLPFAGLTAATDATGSFTITNVPEGTHRLHVTASVDTGELSAPPQDAVVFAGKATTLAPIVLSQAGTATGRLETGAAGGLAGGIVYVPFGDRATLTGDDGRWRLEGVGPGEVPLEARMGGFVVARMTVFVPPGGASDEVTLPLAREDGPSFGVIQGTLVPPDGPAGLARIGNTTVVVEGTAHAASADATGRFRIPNVPAGIYTVLTASADAATVRVPNVSVGAGVTELPPIALRRVDPNDRDQDGTPDGSDPDADGDGHCQPAGPDCPSDAFPLDPLESSDHDEDALGDRADPDDDNDGLPDLEERAVGRDGWRTDPFDTDSDDDAATDPVDRFPLDPLERDDTDGDGEGDRGDNCPFAPNTDQLDTDGDGSGDACDLRIENRAPVLSIEGPAAVDEGEQAEFTIVATDADGDTLSLLLRAAPANATLRDEGDGTGRVTFAPRFDQSGSHLLRVAATDGRTVTEAEFAITVVNRPTADLPPQLEVAGRRRWAEGELVTLTLTAIDSENRETTLRLVSEPPTGALFTDRGDGTGVFTWLAGFDEAGDRTLTFGATNGVAERLVEVALRVDDTNRAPVLRVPARLTAFVGVPAVADLQASDPDGPSPTLQLVSPPPGATLEGLRLTYVAPPEALGEDVTIVIEASDGTLFDRRSIVVTVLAAPNHPPSLATTGATTVDEGTPLTLQVVAADPDGDALTLSARGVPPGATFTDHGDGTATLSFTPGFTQAGAVTIAFLAHDGQLTTILERVLTVTDVPQPPTVVVQGRTRFDEGELVLLAVRAAEVDGRPLTLGVTGAPAAATFVDYGDGTGLFTWPTGFDDAGTPTLRFTAVAGAQSGTADVALEIVNVNRAPAVSLPARREAYAGVPILLEASASDADGESVALTLVSPPPGASLTGTVVAYTAPSGAVGSDVTLTIEGTDGHARTSASCVVSVFAPPNRAPTLAVSGPPTVDEGQRLTLNVTAADADGDAILLFAHDLPANATFTDAGNGTATLAFTPDFTQSGALTLTFVATDGRATTTQARAVVVVDVPGNRPPTLVVGAPGEVDEGTAVVLNVIANDPDGDLLSLGITGKPAAATFTDRGDGTAVFRWATGFSDAGDYNFTILAVAGAHTTTSPVSLRIRNVNRPPTFTAPAPRTVSVGVRLDVPLTATDPDGQPVSFALSTPRTGASLTDAGDGSATFSFTPQAADLGTTIAFDLTATDGTNATTRTQAVTVVAATNLAPVWNAVATQFVNEGQSATYDIVATDPNGTTPTLHATQLATGMSFTDLGGGVGRLSYSPSLDVARATVNAGRTDVQARIDARDGTSSTNLTVTFTVQNVNRPPSLATQVDVAIGAGGTRSVTMLGSDPDPDAVLAYSFTVTPADLAFTVSGATLTATPADTTTPLPREYTVTATLADGVTSVSQPFKLTVEPPAFTRVAATGGPPVSKGLFHRDRFGTRDRFVAVDTWNGLNRIWFLDLKDKTDPAELAWTSVTLATTTPPQTGTIPYYTAYDAIRGVVWLFRLSGAPNAETWKLDLNTDPPEYAYVSNSNPFGGYEERICFLIHDPGTDKVHGCNGYGFSPWTSTAPLFTDKVTMSSQVAYTAVVNTFAYDTVGRRVWSMGGSTSGICQAAMHPQQYTVSPQSFAYTGQPFNGPPFSSGSQAAYDGLANRIVVFSKNPFPDCNTANPAVDSLWQYSIATKIWRELAPNRSLPPPRYGGGFFQVPERNWLILTGGCTRVSITGRCTGTQLTDTWVFHTDRF